MASVKFLVVKYSVTQRFSRPGGGSTINGERREICKIIGRLLEEEVVTFLFHNILSLEPIVVGPKKSQRLTANSISSARKNDLSIITKG